MSSCVSVCVSAGSLTLPAIDALGGYHSGMTDDEADSAQKLGCGVIYFIFAMVDVATILFIIFYVPETKGKTPEELTRGSSLTATEGPGELVGVSSKTRVEALDTL